MPKPVLYSFDISPPVLAVQSTAAAIGLELDIKWVSLSINRQQKNSIVLIVLKSNYLNCYRNIDLTKRENWQDWYLKVEPLK